MTEALSVDLGAVRLTERLLRSDPVKSEEYEGMVALIDRELPPLCALWRKSGSSLTLFGSAGTFTTLAAVEKKLIRYSHSEVHGSRLTLAEVQRQARLFLD